MRDAFYKTLFSEAVRTRQTKMGSLDHYAGVMAKDSSSGLGEDETLFLETRNSIYMASTSSSGYPYMQHRGGPAGFIHVIDPQTIAFADYRGNKQYISAGNIDQAPRVSLFAMDYPRRARLKLIGEAEVVEADADPTLAKRLSKGMEKFVERITKITVTGFDWNCPKYITPRFDEHEMAALLSPRITELTTHIAELETRLTALDPNWKDQR